MIHLLNLKLSHKDSFLEKSLSDLNENLALMLLCWNFYFGKETFFCIGVQPR
jgi:hypothetical protein